MGKITKKELTSEQSAELLNILRRRFENNMERHPDLNWSKIEAKLEIKPGKLWSLNHMEETNGEPDIVNYIKDTDEYIFYDCSTESPQGRRRICYDKEALQSRKEHKPKNSAIGMAAEMGIEILTKEQYLELQRLGKFDTKTSSWIQTPISIRKLGGAIFGDLRYGNVFIYHNGAESYYSTRGFRGSLTV
ncbi:MAG: DUF4256 domain-containing protein [Bacteroidales bacterium]|nr:DUF4256 domain-containing protein [Bacteroidales bacterium]